MLSSHVCDVCETREGFGSEAVCVKWYDPPALGELDYVTWVSHLHMKDELWEQQRATERDLSPLFMPIEEE